MRVKDILNHKHQIHSTADDQSNIEESANKTVLYTVSRETPLKEAIKLMHDFDIGSVVVMSAGEVVGILTFREVIKALHKNNGMIGDGTVSAVMNSNPMQCTCETDISEVRRLMLDGHHARYLPVIEKGCLMGVISLYDIARALVEHQGFENRILKAYIKNWPPTDAQIKSIKKD